MKSLSDLTNPLPGTGLSETDLTGSTVWRVMFALAVVLVLLATTGWTAGNHRHGRPAGPRAAALGAWQEATLNSRALPSVDAAPHVIGRFFRTLDTRRQRQLAERHPLVVGNLNGVPLPVRYRANRLALAQRWASNGPGRATSG